MSYFVVGFRRQRLLFGCGGEEVSPGVVQRIFFVFTLSPVTLSSYHFRKVLCPGGIHGEMCTANHGGNGVRPITQNGQVW